MNKKVKIISVGGSIIIPKTGFDIPFLKKFKSMILGRVKKGERLVLVIGGGATARDYQGAAKKVMKLSSFELDEIGIYATQINAQFVRYIFKEFTPSDIIINPTKKIKSDKPVIIASGWKPGCSTDLDAVLLAKTYGAGEVYNLSNIEYVYDKDPSKYKDAKKIKEINWKDFRKNIVGSKWVAGKSAPFDPIASKEAEKLGLKVSILNGKNLVEVQKALDGKKFKGTIIS
jgi:uridylate kinase